MIAGLPVSTWLLFAAAVGIGLVLEFRFVRRNRRPPGQ
jgi:hypothetical protein